MMFGRVFIKILFKLDVTNYYVGLYTISYRNTSFLQAKVKEARSFYLKGSSFKKLTRIGTRRWIGLLDPDTSLNLRRHRWR